MGMSQIPTIRTAFIFCGNSDRTTRNVAQTLGTNHTRHDDEDAIHCARPPNIRCEDLAWQWKAIPYNARLDSGGQVSAGLQGFRVGTGLRE